MNTAKKLFVQSMAISTAILFLNGINAVIQHFAGNDITLQWYHPVTIVLTGVFCALPTVLLRDSDLLWVMGSQEMAGKLVTAGLLD